MVVIVVSQSASTCVCERCAPPSEALAGHVTTAEQKLLCVESTDDQQGELWLHTHTHTQHDLG